MINSFRNKIDNCKNFFDWNETEIICDWDEIIFICENNKVTRKKFLYFGMKITLTNINDVKTLIINEIQEDRVDFFNNLPQNIDGIVIYIHETFNTRYLMNMFTNLPSNLKLIKFVYSNSKISELKNMELRGKFNILFNIKLPFNCNFIVNYENEDYKANYLENNVSLELTLDSKIIIINFAFEIINDYVTKKRPTNIINIGGTTGGLMLYHIY